jgi:hypothetical protein
MQPAKHTCRHLLLIILSLGFLLAMTAPNKSRARNRVHLASVPATAVMQEPPLPEQAMTRMTAYFEARRNSRYMEQNCVSTTYPGWETLPLKECTYSVKGAHDPVQKTAKVIMLNAEPEQLARWVVDLY